MFTDMKKRHRDKFTIGFTYFADCYCYECGESLPEIDPEGNDKGIVATWDRSDCAEWSCGKCGLPISVWGF